MRVPSRIITSVAIAATAFFVCAPAHAIPAWTRATGAACNSCHFGASNRLTKMGWDFLQRGLRMPGQEGFTSDDPGEVNFLHYASIGARGDLSTQEDRDPSTRFATSAVSLEAGGPLIQNLSFWAAYDLHPEAELGEAFLQYTSDTEASTYWSARVGKLSPHVKWMAYRVPGGPGAVLSAAPGLNNPYRIGNGADGISLGYNTEGGLRAEAGIVNGSTAGPANNSKDFYGSLQQFFDDYGSAVGVFAYKGDYAFTAGTPPVAQADKPDFTRIGLLGQYMRENWEVHSAYFTGQSDLRTGGDHSPTAFQIQFDYNTRPNHTAYILYSDVDNDVPSPLVTPTTTTGVQAYGVGYALRYTDWARFSVGLTSTKTERSASDNTVNALSFGWNFWF